jgi:hypothetical protein
MLRRSIIGLILFLGAAAVPISQSQVADAQPASCQFELGFQTLHDMIPTIVGDCLENEWHNAYNGDGLQRTTTGLLVWRKADNWTAFTNGYFTWINGTFGLQSRLNTEHFAWEAPDDGSALIPDTGVSVPTAPAVAPAPTATPVVQTVVVQPPSDDNDSGDNDNSNDSQPRVSLSIDPDRVSKGQHFTVRITGRGGDGLSRIWWWATNTGQSSLSDTHTHDCDGSDPCRFDWSEGANDSGSFTIHARARDRNGNESDDATHEVHVR